MLNTSAAVAQGKAKIQSRKVAAFVRAVKADLEPLAAAGRAAGQRAYVRNRFV